MRRRSKARRSKKGKLARRSKRGKRRSGKSINKYAVSRGGIRL